MNRSQGGSAGYVQIDSDYVLRSLAGRKATEQALALDYGAAEAEFRSQIVGQPR